MYCIACELEIKGDDKETCPICGGPLSEVQQDAVALSDQDSREHTPIGEIIEDINSLIGQDEPSPEHSDSGQDAVFMLKDYDADSLTMPEGESPSAVNGQPDPDPVEDLSAQAESEMQPLSTDVSPGSDGSLDDMLDSLRQSMDLPEDSDDSRASVVEMSAQEGGEDFSFLKDAELIESDDIPTDSPNETSSDTFSVIEENAGETSESKRKPFFVIAVIIILLAGGYYVFSIFSGDRNGDDKTVRTVVPLAELQNDGQSMQSETVTPDASVLSASAKPAPVAEEDVVQTVSSDSQKVPSAAVQPEQSKTAEASVAAAQEKPDSSAPAATAKPAKPAKPAADAAPVAAPAKDTASAQPVPVSSSPEEQLSGKPFYTVHVGSYRTRDAAAAEAARIKAKGYNPFLERVDLAQRGVWFRVKIGKFTTKGEAEQLRKKIHKSLVQDSRVVMNPPE